jgi:two-component system probable response regulator PhcQ
MKDLESTVLLVDDDPPVIHGLIRNLRREPYRLLSANSGKEALEVLACEKVDIVISDEQMPGMTGAELVSHIRKQYPHIICMMLSGNTSFEAAIQAINQGNIYRYLRKPCDPLEVATDIRLALQQRNLIIEARKLTDQYQEKIVLIDKLEKECPGIFDIKFDEQGCLILNDVPDVMHNVLSGAKKKPK